MRVRQEYESQEVEAYAYLDDITIAAHEISPGTVGAADEISPGTMGVVPFLEGELTARGIHLNPGKTVALAPKGHVPTPEDVSL